MEAKCLDFMRRFSLKKIYVLLEYLILFRFFFSLPHILNCNGIPLDWWTDWYFYDFFLTLCCMSFFSLLRLQTKYVCILTNWESLSKMFPLFSFGIIKIVSIECDVRHYRILFRHFPELPSEFSFFNLIQCCEQ